MSDPRNPRQGTSGLEPGCVGRHDEGVDATVSGARVGLGIDEGDVGDVAVGDPEFGAVDDRVAVADRAGAHRAEQVGVAVGLVMALAPSASPEINAGTQR